jgi:hypothetical protein
MKANFKSRGALRPTSPPGRYAPVLHTVFYLEEEEEIDGDFLFKLPYEEIKKLFPKLKQRTLFMDEREKLSQRLFSEKSQSSMSMDDDQEGQSLFIDESVKSSDSIPFVEEIVTKY